MKAIRIMLLLGCLLAAGAGTPSAEDFRAVLTDGRLSLSADGIALQRIFRRLAEQGVRILADPRADPPITAAFEDREVSRGLETILRPHGYSHALIWESVEGPVGPWVRLREIRVFEPGGESRMRPLDDRAKGGITIDPRSGDRYLADEILIRPAPGVGLRPFRRLLREMGGTVIDGHAGVGAYRIRLTEPADIPGLSETLKRHPAVAAAEPNYVYPVSAPEPVRHGGGGGRSFSGAGGTLTEGEIAVAVLDTGLRPGALPEGMVAASMDAVDPGRPVGDDAGHGTQMALIASGMVAPLGVTGGNGTVRIIPVRTFDEDGHASTFGVMKGIDFALNSGAEVMSLSWGSERYSVFLKDALDAAAARGVVITASAGNEPTGRPVYPAAYDSVIGVGALGVDGKPWERSNSGDFVRVYAPGFADMPVGYNGNPGIYAGTSIAAAYAAHRVARYLAEHPGKAVGDLFQAVEND